ncbi:hypothetical protein IV454_12205 [Massilia antarctica]|uniref:Uncharacterized protein n=1 Tax=Massilia antarctica TaxID=2765360 RepID=A0AA49AAR7_9BURK|nr:hypothetical protein [Massilia antarctica]QPI52187.1 hypothetical protein IV454_12205 [Massilia antarctica]
MPYFDLRLGFAPSFHRGGTIRVEGDVTGAATFEADPTGLLPGLVFTLPVDARGMAAIHDGCSAMLAGWDDRWSESGFDGMCLGGTFASPDVQPRHFSLWSPDQDTAAHAMLRAVFDCFPPERCAGVAEAQLESIRGYLGLQPPVTMYDEVPLRLRLAPCAHRNDANEIETHVRALPDDCDLIVDVSGLDGLFRALAQILPMDLLLKRSPAVRWRVQGKAGEALIAYGIAASAISTIERAPISEEGHPVVLGGYVISSPELISLAQDGARIALVSALRRQCAMTVLDGAKAAAELIHIMETYPRQS